MPRRMSSLWSSCAPEPGGRQQSKNNGWEVCIHTATLCVKIRMVLYSRYRQLEAAAFMESSVAEMNIRVEDASIFGIQIGLYAVEQLHPCSQLLPISFSVTLIYNANENHVEA